MWSAGPSQLTTMRVSSKDLCSIGVGDGARAAVNGPAVMGLADSKKIQETRAGPGQASSGGGERGTMGVQSNANTCSAAAPTADTFFLLYLIEVRCEVRSIPCASSLATCTVNIVHLAISCMHCQIRRRNMSTKYGWPTHAVNSQETSGEDTCPDVALGHPLQGACCA